jgi:3-oxoacyl-[acyl-carrier-protein] synthase III
MNCRISKIETYFPEGILSNEMIASEFPNWNSEKIEDKLGIKSRHIVSENETALDLAVKAGTKALQNYDTNNIGFVILCTQSADYYLPSSACILQSKLGLNTNIGAFDFNLGCSGFIYGLGIAKALITSNMTKSILLVMSETYTKHINKLDFANRSIFGDGASAIIIEPSPDLHIHEFIFGTDGTGADNLIVPNGGLRAKYDSNVTLITDESGNQRTNNNLYMNGPEIFNFTIEAVPSVIQNVLEINNINSENVDYFIFHQANKYMLDYLRKKMKIPKEKFYNNMLTTGNTVSSTIPIALKDCIDSRIVKKGDTVLLCGFGVGYSWGATILTI